jgi:heptosyltransferase III
VRGTGNGSGVPAAWPRRALIVKLRHIGDALLGTGVATALKGAAPDCHVTYLAAAGTDALPRLCPDVDEVVAVERDWGRGSRQGLAAQGRLLLALRRARFDLALDLGGGDRAAFLIRWSGAPVRVGVAAAHATGRLRCRAYTRLVTPDIWAHTVQQDLDVLRAGGVAAATAPVRLAVPAALAEQARARLAAAGLGGAGPLLVVHPTSRWRFKTWPEARVAACVAALAGRGFRVALTCGPDPEERRDLRGILARSGGAGTGLEVQTLPELAALLGAADLFLGVDSSPAHLAAALGVPAVVLFGPTGAYNWGPWVATPERTPYPARGGRQVAGPHTILQADWLCAGCGMAGCLGSRRSQCLEQITLDEVLEVVRAGLDRAGRVADRATG